MTIKTDPVNGIVAWLHDQPNKCFVMHDKSKRIWLKAAPAQVEHYTIPLYLHQERQPLSTEAACELLNAIGIDPMLDGNMLKLLRVVEQAHGIGDNTTLSMDRMSTPIRHYPLLF